MITPSQLLENINIFDVFEDLIQLKFNIIDHHKYWKDHPDHREELLNIERMTARAIIICNNYKLFEEHDTENYPYEKLLIRALSRKMYHKTKKFNNIALQNLNNYGKYIILNNKSISKFEDLKQLMTFFYVIYTEFLVLGLYNTADNDINNKLDITAKKINHLIIKPVYNDLKYTIRYDYIPPHVKSVII